MTIFEIGSRNRQAYLDHVLKGSPEADEQLNDANREAIRAYTAERPDAVCLRMNADGEPFFRPSEVEQLFNFCASYIFDGAAGNLERIRQAEKKWRKTGKIEALYLLEAELSRADALLLIWS